LSELNFPNLSDFMYWAGIAAVAVSAVSGTLESGARRMDIVGVTVVALATALGGGTARDLLLSRPIFWVVDPSYLYTAFFAAFLTFFVARAVYLPARLFVIPDAIGLAIFTVVGAQAALDMRVSWFVAVMMGVVTAAFGGVVRDIFCNMVPLVFLPGYLYAAASFFGAVAFIVFQEVLGVGHVAAGWIGMGVAFCLRLLGMYLKVMLPEFKSRE
jgi:uncharacterized membrane protein YeiH